MAGLISLVGAGPGDPSLITVAGLKRLKEADVVVYDRLASDRLLEHVRPDAERVYVGKQPGHHALSQEEINQVLLDRGRAGKKVCRLKGGDPFVFGRGGEEALACQEAGIPFEVIPGVTSAIAAPAYAGIPVTHRQVAASFAVITGHEDPTRPSSPINWEKLARATDTLVFLMGVENLEEIVDRLQEYGRSGSTPAAVVQWGTYPRQRTLTGTLDTIAATVKEAGLKPPAVTIVGDVVSLRERLQWFDCRPLFGKRVLVTRSREQASDLVSQLEDLGAEVVQAPAIRVRPYTLAEASTLPELLRTPFDWVLFNSVNAVRCFFDLVRESSGDVRSIGSARVAAVGPVTAQALEATGLRVDFVPGEAVSSKIAAAFPEPLSGKRIFFPRPREAPDDLPGALEQAGAAVTVLPVYETLAEDLPAELRDQVMSGQVQIITFTSSSTVRSFLTLIPAEQVSAAVQIVCIGPVTADTAKTAGLRVDAVAEEHTIPGLVQAILRLQNQAS